MSYVTDRELIEGYEALEEHVQELSESAEEHVQELGEAYEEHIQELGESAVIELDDVNDLIDLNK